MHPHGPSATRPRMGNPLSHSWPGSGWQGVFVGGAPLELMNPGMADELHRAIKVPVSTALESCVTALKAFSAKQFLLMTPFDDSMNQLIKDYLTKQGLTAISPPPLFKDYKDATKLRPEDVFSLTKECVESVKDFQAIYFQGGVLDPLAVVKFVGYGRANGRSIILDHGQGITTQYSHLSKAHVKKGQQVTRAQRIASIGSTGKSTNPHLHYEVRVNRIPIDPRRYLIKKAPSL